MDRVKGKVALVTGGAMGMGKTHSETLAAEGAMVFVTDLNEEGGKAVVKGIQDAGGKAEFIKHNASSEADWANVAATIKAKAGKLDVLVNNAGILILKPAHETEPDEWDQVFNVNVKGVYLGIRACVPLMKDAGGSIVNISSI
jgi:cyclopentanol dehydrogenase